MDKINDCSLNDILGKKVRAKLYSPLALAFIGDSIYDVVIRTMVVKKGNAPVNKLHVACRDYVKASEQAKIALYLQEKEILTDEEEAVFRRGRNAKTNTGAKNSTAREYSLATGLEALVGFLYLDGRMERVMEIMAIGIEHLDQDKRDGGDNE